MSTQEQAISGLILIEESAAFDLTGRRMHLGAGAGDENLVISDSDRGGGADSGEDLARASSSSSFSIIKCCAQARV